jgi:DNA-binding response OmpR family regulator
MAAEAKHQHVALVEDEVVYGRVLQHQLRRLGYLCHLIPSGTALLDYLATGQRPDLFILDYFLGLAEPTGLALCRRIRALGDTPVIMLTGNEAVDTLVACLNAGADQYLVKPCDIRELDARILAALRRARPKGQDAPAAPTVLDDRVELDWRGQCLRGPDGRDLRLTDKEMALLELLLGSADRQVDRAAAFHALYGFEPPPQNRSIDVIASRLRRKLAAIESRHTIRATRGQGYRLSPR